MSIEPLSRCLKCYFLKISIHCCCRVFNTKYALPTCHESYTMADFQAYTPTCGRCVEIFTITKYGYFRKVGLQARGQRFNRHDLMTVCQCLFVIIIQSSHIWSQCFGDWVMFDNQPHYLLNPL